MQARKLKRSLGAIALLSVVGVGCHKGHEPPPPPEMVNSAPPPGPSVVSVRKRPSATAVELALVAPWKEGFSVGGFTVARVEGVEGGVFRVVCKKEHASIALTVAMVADAGPLPPAGTDRFSVFYETRGATPDEGVALATALAKALEANASAPPPTDLGKFDPAAESGVEL
jgi:hypothetical protein